MTFILIGLVLALTVYGQLIVKARAIFYSEGEPMSRTEYLVLMFTDVHVLAGLGAAAAASAFWILAIERASLSFAYPFMALSFVLVPIGSQIWFGEFNLAPAIYGDQPDLRWRWPQRNRSVSRSCRLSHRAIEAPLPQSGFFPRFGLSQAT